MSKKMKWASFNRFEFQMPEQAVDECHHTGACDADVAYWADKLKIGVDSELIRAELKEYGAWDKEELADDRANLERIIWLAAGNIQEEERQDARDAEKD